MWKAYGKSLFRKRNSIEVKEYFIQREKKRYMYIRHVVSGGKYKQIQHEVINLIELEKKTKRTSRVYFLPSSLIPFIPRLLINFHYLDKRISFPKNQNFSFDISFHLFPSIVKELEYRIQAYTQPYNAVEAASPT